MKNNEKTNKYLFFRKKDLILYFLLLVICAFAVIVIPELYKSKDKYLYVYSGGALESVHAMDKDMTHKVYNNGHYNLIVIENGRAYIKEADCSDKICLNSGKIKNNGESIICMPHKLKIEIKGTKPQGGDI